MKKNLQFKGKGMNLGFILCLFFFLFGGVMSYAQSNMQARYQYDAEALEQAYGDDFGTKNQFRENLYREILDLRNNNSMNEVTKSVEMVFLQSSYESFVKNQNELVALSSGLLTAEKKLQTFADVDVDILAILEKYYKKLTI